MKRCGVCLCAALCVGWLSSGPVASIARGQASVLGVANKSASTGRSVQAPGGVMVDYVEELETLNIRLPMRPIPAGTLRFASEHPSALQGGGDVTIKIPEFWIAQYEISWQQYAVFVGLDQALSDLQESSGKSSRDFDAPDAVTAPSLIYDPQGRLRYADSDSVSAGSMTQYAARQFTKWLSLRTGRQYRLATEAEWTYACVAAGTTVTLAQQPSAPTEAEAATNLEQQDGPQQGGRNRPNAWGLYDMCGNVAEYVLDADGKDLFSRLKPGEYSIWETVGKSKERYTDLACGGNCWSQPADCTARSRIVVDIDYWTQEANLPLSPTWLASPEKDSAIGFRIVRSFSPLDETRMQQCWNVDNEELRDAVEDRVRTQKCRVGVIPIQDRIHTKPDLPFGKTTGDSSR